jgi:hypothetical protein
METLVLKCWIESIVVVVFQGLGLLACSGSELIFWNLWIYLDIW